MFNENLIPSQFSVSGARDCYPLRQEMQVYFVLFVCCIFILLPRESNGGAVFWTNPHPLRSNCPFPSFPVVSLTSYHLICCLFGSHQTEIIIVKAPNPTTRQRVRRGWEFRLRTPSAGSDSPPPWLSRIRASPACHFRHYFFYFWPLVQTFGRGPVWSPWSSSTPPSLGRDRVAPPPPGWEFNLDHTATVKMTL